MNLPHSITLLPKSAITSNISGFGYSYPATGTAYRAYVQHRSESLAQINNTGGFSSGITIYAEPACPATNLDRFTFDGATYEITGVMPQRTPRGTHHIKIMAVELSQK